MDKRIDIERLKQEQLRLAKEVITADTFKGYETVAGIDHAYFSGKILAAIVVIDTSGKILERKYTVKDDTFPYIPGFLSYKEGPVMAEAFSYLDHKPDILIIAGNGILHPRRFGIATHIGLLTDTPAIGVAKKLLLGREKGNEVEVDNEVRAIKFQSREHAKPVYISPGHKISLKTSVRIVKELTKGAKLPLPLKLAHQYANKIRDQLVQEEQVTEAAPAQ
ncbi:endonuclease V [Candidatus Woesearchaeota archaeon]|nr:endonuclease V [Candidatus Woesearchaeota archaeon]